VSIYLHKPPQSIQLCNVRYVSSMDPWYCSERTSCFIHFNALKTKRVCCIYTQFVPRSKHSPSRLCKTNQLMLYEVRLAVCRKTHTQHILLQSALQPSVWFRSAQLPLNILSRKVLQSAVVSGTSNPQLGEEPGI
jgi:hypothetical protein